MFEAPTFEVSFELFHHGQGFELRADIPEDEVTAAG